jgi:LysM repeat protein
MAIGDPSAPEIRKLVNDKAKKENVTVPRTALNNFVDTYSKTRVGPIHRAIGKFFNGIRDEAVSTAKTQQAKNEAAKKKAAAKFAPQKKRATPKGMADKKSAPKKVATSTSTKKAAPKNMADKKAAKSYRIVSGDTLSAIAARNDTTVAELKRLNNIQDVNKIYAGKTLKLPTRSMKTPKPKPKRKK